MDKTVQEVIDTIISAIPGAPFPETVDTLKTGSPGQAVTGIAVTFMATCEVIEQTIQLGANLIVTHEPTFYNHLDETGWLDGDPVYTAKRRLLEQHHIAVWRFHDYLHSLQPDPTIIGLLKTLGWLEHADPAQHYFCHLPPRRLGDLVDEIKSKLGLAAIRFVGEPAAECARVGIMVGACGGRMHIQGLGHPIVDVLLCGELNEWETSEYVRDALHLGQSKAVVVLGHAASEEAGMREVIPWLQAHLPQVKIDFIPAGHPFLWL